MNDGSCGKIKEAFRSVSAKVPWYDDWSDEKKPDSYIRDLVCQSNSLSNGLYEEKKLREFLW